ncbi:hypothetical protein [uncultured Piscinibacter sp.]|uniref:ComEC/Rec2 family competence protein n=1 Tax=uncultured Piscinibacter sp. TaxID=1131835 RepID=UPI00263502DA|nr:hypothetical protein [uncultured Piscinibacter sp.]
MTAPDLLFEALPAGYGDALLVTCSVDGRPWRMLVDTGPDESWPMLRTRLAAVPLGADGKRRIDLAVISHIDHDHIGATRQLFDDRELGLDFGDVWFNAPPTRGVAEGAALATLLRATGRALPWNLAWHGGLAVTPVERPFVEVPAGPHAPKLTLLSPTAKGLETLFAVWERELAKLGRRPRVRPRHASRGLVQPGVAELADRKTPLDRAPANGSSIALLLEHAGASLLLAADAHAPVLVAALEALAAHRGQPLPLPVDVFKLSHHGSRANITTALLRTVRAQHYVVSTNGAMFDHPDEEAIARTVCEGPGGHTIWFNHANEHSARWAATPLNAWRCSVVEPEAPGGVRLEARGGRWRATAAA